MVDLEKEVVARKILEVIEEFFLKQGYKIESFSFDKNMNDELEVKIVKI